METLMDTKIYRIMGRYHGKVEEVDVAEGEETAKYLVGEYALDKGRQWQVWAEDEDGNRLN